MYSDYISAQKQKKYIRDPSHQLSDALFKDHIQVKLKKPTIILD